MYTYEYVRIYVCAQMHTHTHTHMQACAQTHRHCWGRETRKVDQSEGRQGEDSKEGAAHIVALLA